MSLLDDASTALGELIDARVDAMRLSATGADGEQGLRPWLAPLGGRYQPRR